MTVLPAGSTATVRNWPGKKSKGRAPPSVGTSRSVRTFWTSAKVRQTSMEPDHLVSGAAGAARLLAEGAVEGVTGAALAPDSASEESLRGGGGSDGATGDEASAARSSCVRRTFEKCSHAAAVAMPTRSVIEKK